MTAWHDYQGRAADFFRDLGMDANVDERLKGARGQHDVDVVVRATRAGIEQVWVVECKWWRRAVTKVHVAALAQIVQDVGADRGIILSEKGFQAGAISLASSSNITLTSLAELNESAEAMDLPIRAATLMGAWALDALGRLGQSLNLSNFGHDETPDLRTLIRQAERKIQDGKSPRTSITSIEHEQGGITRRGLRCACRHDDQSSGCHRPACPALRDTRVGGTRATVPRGYTPPTCVIRRWQLKFGST
jgi:hypothetical protein